jgi:hypothetical protein
MLVIPDVNKKKCHSGTKMTSPRGKLTAMACHLTKKVNKADELTYLFTNIVKYFGYFGNCFGYFSKNWANCYATHLVTLINAINIQPGCKLSGSHKHSDLLRKLQKKVLYYLSIQPMILISCTFLGGVASFCRKHFADKFFCGIWPTDNWPTR